MRPLTQGRRLAQVLGATLVAGGLVVSAAGIASAVEANPTGPSNVIIDDDFANYPSVDLGDCVDGSGFLEGLLYDVDRGEEGSAAGAADVVDATSLHESGPVGRLYPGDVVTATWDDFGCGETDGDSIGVALALKSAPSPVFDPNVDQLLLESFAFCGDIDGAVPCDGESSAGNTLTLTMPPYSETCAYQIDLVIGGPLRIVGTGGSFYGSNLRGDGGPNMLIGANNGGPDACAEVEKVVEVAEGATAPADQQYVICLSPAATPQDNEVCPPEAIEVIVADGESATVEVTPGTVYEITELFGEDSVLAGQLTPTAGAGNAVVVTNLYRCADVEGQPRPPTSEDGTVVIDVDCTPVTTIPTTTPTTTPTTAPPCVNCRNEETTTTTVASTTTAAATTVATTIPDRSATPPPDEEVAGTTVQPAEELPVTGTGTWPAARLGILMVLSGAAALAMSKRRQAEA